MTNSGGRSGLLTGPCTVLVTGGCGFIGHHLVRRLLQDGHRVRVLDDLSTGVLENLPNHPALSFRLGSVLDPAAVAQAARGANLTVHLAGVVGMRLAVRHPWLAYLTSLRGTRNVLGATSRPVVLASSSAVYGLAADADTHESNPVLPGQALAYDGGRRGYAAGKWVLEREACRAARAGHPTLVVRPFNVVGSGQSAVYGMVLPRFMASALCGRPLVVYGDGTQTRSFSDVVAFVDVLLRLVRTPAAWSAPRNVVNIGNPVPVSIHELAALVLDVTGSSSPVQFVPFESVFPGKQDVLQRCPQVERLESLVGPVDWPGMRDIIVRLGDGAPAEPVSLISSTRGVQPVMKRLLSVPDRSPL